MTGLSIAPGCSIPPRMLSRHVGIFGATGTGKTTTAAALVDRAPCPVLVIDAKGDLERAGQLYRPRVNLQHMGPDLIARALELSDAQAGALHVAMAWADDTGRPVATLQELRDLLTDTATTPLPYGLVTGASVAAVQRAILRLERACPWAFGPGAPDWRKAQDVTVLGAAPVAQVPGVYGALVAHILDTLYRGLGELGDVAPGLLVMVDESHLLFNDAPPAVVRRLEQITRLIRSKGVGLIYVTQSPADLPDAILAQLATRIQHGLRAATPRQAAALRAAAETMPGNVRADDVAQLGTGQALVSIPDGAGRPQPARLVTVTPGALPMGAVNWQPPSVAPVLERRPVTVEPEPDPPRRRWRDSLWWCMLAPVIVLWGAVLVSHIT